jgi:hypothetical protein
MEDDETPTRIPSLSHFVYVLHVSKKCDRFLRFMKLRQTHELLRLLSLCITEIFSINLFGF